MKPSKIINLFGPPCSAKSTTAAGLFYDLKLDGYSVELVTEFAKELTYLERRKCLADQFYVTAQQNHRMHALIGKVDYIITDSPILLSVAYVPKSYPLSFSRFVFDLFNTYNNLNFFLKRAVPYVEDGRNQTEAESDEVCVKLHEFLIDNNVNFTEVDGCRKAAKVIRNLLIKR